MRTDPLGVARVRHGLKLSRQDMGNLLGVDPSEDADAVIRAIENGEHPITAPMARLLATLELAMPGDGVLHPKFFLAESAPQLDQFVVHTRYPRFYGRLVAIGTPVAQMTTIPVDDSEMLVVYLWHDDPETVSPEVLDVIMAEARDFVISHKSFYESMDADFDPSNVGDNLVY